jgi:hypothetical protein
MNLRPEMSWTCPDGQSRNATTIAAEAEAGGTVDVRCRLRGTEHEASVFFALTQAGAPLAVGVVWA